MKKNKLVVAPGKVEFGGAEETGGNLVIDISNDVIDNSNDKKAVFNFLKKSIDEDRNVYMVVSYLQSPE